MSQYTERGRDGRQRFQTLWTLPATGIALLLIALSGCSGTGANVAAAPGGAKGGRKGLGGDVPVTVAVSVSKNVPVEVQVIGHVEAYSTISVNAQVTGELTKACLLYTS